MPPCVLRGFSSGEAVPASGSRQAVSASRDCDRVTKLAEGPGKDHPRGGPLRGDGGAEDAIPLGTHVRGLVSGDKSDPEGKDGDGVADDDAPPACLRHKGHSVPNKPAI